MQIHKGYLNWFIKKFSDTHKQILKILAHDTNFITFNKYLFNSPNQIWVYDIYYGKFYQDSFSFNPIFELRFKVDKYFLKKKLMKLMR